MPDSNSAINNTVGASISGVTNTLTVTNPSDTASSVARSTITVGGGSSSTSGAGSTVTITSTGGGLSWTEVVVVGPTAMTVDTGFIANNGATVGLLLPLTAALGSVIQIVGKGAGGFQLTQNAGQTTHLVGSSTTTGVGGTIDSSEAGATLAMVCITADTDWRIFSSTGNLIIT